MTMAEGGSMADDGYTIVIGDKNYSSWSLRPWLALKACDIPFQEERIRLRQPESKAEILRLSPSGKVPALKTELGIIWDSLAILEYLAEQHPRAELWPGIPRSARRGALRSPPRCTQDSPRCATTCPWTSSRDCPPRP